MASCKEISDASFLEAATQQEPIKDRAIGAADRSSAQLQWKSIESLTSEMNCWPAFPEYSFFVVSCSARLTLSKTSLADAVAILIDDYRYLVLLWALMGLVAALIEIWRFG